DKAQPVWLSLAKRRLLVDVVDLMQWHHKGAECVGKVLLGTFVVTSRERQRDCNRGWKVGLGGLRDELLTPIRDLDSLPHDRPSLATLGRFEDSAGETQRLLDITGD